MVEARKPKATKHTGRISLQRCVMPFGHNLIDGGDDQVFEHIVMSSVCSRAAAAVIGGSLKQFLPPFMRTGYRAATRVGFDLQ